MKLLKAVILYAALLFLTDIISIEQYEKIVIEPLSVAIKTPVAIGNNSLFHLSIYILFGKHKFKPFYNEAGDIAPVCGDKRCIFSIAICIRMTINADEFKFNLTNRTPSVEVDLDDIKDDVNKQNAFIELFPDIIKQGDVDEVRFTTVPGTLDNLQNGLIFVPLYLNGITSNDTRIWLHNTKVIKIVDNQVVQDDGSSFDGGISTYVITGNPVNTTELVKAETCAFHRKLAMLSFCSEQFFNSEMCGYYKRLIAFEIACGGDLKEGIIRIGIYGMITKILKAIWDFIRDLLNRITI
eukprot:GAHX01002448.1.p1 GENE.GAHX01002448.1~~GAHX01002448.1.p1  ORF type:complete len:296 (-),score=39.94 GAHX01002448.1:7-894(-)